MTVAVRVGCWEVDSMGASQEPRPAPVREGVSFRVSLGTLLLLA
ncbi:MAG TPA: hypothetical protein VFV75_09735 [Candidatus Polarisedimenticolaceae bacterium]|nr:hypothetical protein [Candidatus Polarisedimenticolaceae bacterium]